MTVEELQEQLLKEQEEKKALQLEKENFNKKLEELNKQLDETKAFNQKLYLRITEDAKKEEIIDNGNKEVKSIEDFCKDIYNKF